MVAAKRVTVLIIIAAGAVLLARGDLFGLYFLPLAILLTFFAVGMNSRVLLIKD